MLGAGSQRTRNSLLQVGPAAVLCLVLGKWKVNQDQSKTGSTSLTEGRQGGGGEEREEEGVMENKGRDPSICLCTWASVRKKWRK